MRILLVSHYNLPHIGGIEGVVHGYASELARRGHEVVSVFARPWPPRGTAEEPQRRYRAVEVDALNHLEWRLEVPYPLFSPRLVPSLAKEIRAADVIHAHGFLYMSSVLALLQGRLAARGRPRRPVRVLTEHVGFVPYRSRAVATVERAAIASVGHLAVRSADAVVVFNDRVADEIRRIARSTPVAFIPNGVDTSDFRPPDPGERERLRQELGWDNRPRALFVGRLVRRKGVDEVAAAAALADGRFRAVLVGPGDAGALADAPHVDVLGPHPRATLARLYRAADCLVLPSVGEGFPVVAQEALASGLPVILRAGRDYDTYRRRASPALVFASAGAPSLVAAVEGLLRTRGADGGLADAATRLAEELFTWDACLDRHLRLYRAVREGRSPEGIGLS